MNFVEHAEFYDNISCYPEHKHTSTEIFFVTEGEIKIGADNNTYTVAENQLCIIPCNVPHCTDSNDTSYKRWLFFVNPWQLSRIFFSSEIQGVLSGISFRKPLVISLPKVCEKNCEIIAEEYRRRERMSDNIVFSQMIYLLSLAVQHIINEHDFVLTKQLKQVMEIQLYIEENCCTRIKISDIAEHFYISKYYLTHIFKECTGITPQQFLMDCRVKKAETMLKNTDASILEISEACGFVSPSDFAARFKKQHNINPASYRKNFSNQNFSNI